MAKTESEIVYNNFGKSKLDLDFLVREEQKEFGLWITFSEEAKREEELDWEKVVQIVKEGRRGSWTLNNLPKSVTRRTGEDGSKSEEEWGVPSVRPEGKIWSSWLCISTPK